MVFYFSGNINLPIYISIITIVRLLIINFVHLLLSKMIGRLVTKLGYKGKLSRKEGNPNFLKSQKRKRGFRLPLSVEAR